MHAHIRIPAQVIPPKGWYPEQPKSQEETEALIAELKLMVPPIRQYVSGARGAYQLALVRFFWVGLPSGVAIVMCDR